MIVLILIIIPKLKLKIHKKDNKYIKILNDL